MRTFEFRVGQDVVDVVKFDGHGHVTYETDHARGVVKSLRRYAGSLNAVPALLAGWTNGYAVMVEVDRTGSAATG
jgi:hypothetical protein